MRGYGAEVILTSASRGMAGAVEEAARIEKERGAWFMNQFSNMDAVAVHYDSTGREIHFDSDGKMDALVAGVGSGSSLTGAGKYLKESLPGFRVIAVEPEESPVLSGGQPGPHAIQGIGAGFIPAVLDLELIDEIMLANGEEAREMALKIMKVEGLSAGISTGANVACALKIAARPEMEGKNIVTFACDCGERYLSTDLFTGY